MTDGDHLDDRLCRWLSEGALTGSARVGAIAHLRECSECRRRFVSRYGPIPALDGAARAAAPASVLVPSGPDRDPPEPDAPELPFARPAPPRQGGSPIRRSQPPPALIVLIVGAALMLGLGAMLVSWITMFSR